MFMVSKNISKIYKFMFAQGGKGSGVLIIILKKFQGVRNKNDKICIWDVGLVEFG